MGFNQYVYLGPCIEIKESDFDKIQSYISEDDSFYWFFQSDFEDLYYLVPNIDFGNKKDFLTFQWADYEPQSRTEIPKDFNVPKVITVFEDFFKAQILKIKELEVEPKIVFKILTGAS